MVAVAAIVTVIRTPVVVVGASREIVPMVRVGALNIPRTSSLGNDSGVVRALDRNAPAPVQAAVNIHTALGIMHIADSAIGASLDRAAVLQMSLLASLGNRPSSRNARIGRMRGGVSRVRARCSSSRGRSRVTSRGRSRVTGGGRSRVTSRGRSRVTSRGRGRVTSRGRGRVTSRGRGRVTSRGRGRVTSRGRGRVTSRGRGRVTSRGRGRVTSRGRGRVTSRGRGRVTSRGRRLGRCWLVRGRPGRCCRRLGRCRLVGSRPGRCRSARGSGTGCRGPGWCPFIRGSLRRRACRLLIIRLG